MPSRATAAFPSRRIRPLVAYKKIVSQGGPLRLDANHPNGLRDEVANVLIASLLNRQSQRFTNVAQTGAANGGYGTLNIPGSWPTPTGMACRIAGRRRWARIRPWTTTPTRFRRARSSPHTPAGYTLLEEYLHFRATPHAVLGKVQPDSPTAQDVDLRRYTRGFTNKPPVTYTVSNVSTGTVTLVGGDRGALRAAHQLLRPRQL